MEHTSIVHIITLNALMVQVADSRGHTLFQKDDVSNGKFAFTTEDYDMFEVCFHSTVVGKYITYMYMYICTLYVYTYKNNYKR